MNWLDIILIIIWLIFPLLGLRMKFTGAFALFAGGFLGVYFGARYSSSLAERFDFAGGELLSKIISFVIIFLATIACVYLAGLLIRKFLKLAFLGWLDRLLGFVLGALLGWVICGGFLFLLTEYIVPYSGAFRDAIENALSTSLLYPLFRASLPFILKFIPLGGLYGA